MEPSGMASFCALLSLVFMIAFVSLFDVIHQRNRHYRRLRVMYEGVVQHYASTN
jgi:flagellar biosynthesis protein FlhB